MGCFFFFDFLFFSLFICSVCFCLSSLCNCNFCQNISHERTFNNDKDKDKEERSFESDFGERRRANRFFCERTNRNGDDGSARKERLGEDVLTVRDSSATCVQGKSRLEEIHGRYSRRRGETDEGK